MASCPTLTIIDPTWCIGNSLQYINSNFTGLSSSVCGKVNRYGDTMTGDLDFSGNKINHFGVTVKEISVTPQSTTYSLTPSDCGCVLNVTCTSNGYISVPTGLPIGFNCMIVNKSTNSLTISHVVGAAVQNAYQKITIGVQWGICNLIIVQENTALIAGDLV